jgi:LigD-like primase-polymerase
MAAQDASRRVPVAGIAVSHPDRVIYADLGLTKLDIARYYDAIAERMLPHVAGRPLTLLRCAGPIRCPPLSPASSGLRPSGQGRQMAASGGTIFDRRASELRRRVLVVREDGEATRNEISESRSGNSRGMPIAAPPARRGPLLPTDAPDIMDVGGVTGVGPAANTTWTPSVL